MVYVILQESLGFVGGSLTKLVLETTPPSVLLNGPPTMSNFLFHINHLSNIYQNILTFSLSDGRFQRYSTFYVYVCTVNGLAPITRY